MDNCQHKTNWQGKTIQDLFRNHIATMSTGINHVAIAAIQATTKIINTLLPQRGTARISPIAVTRNLASFALQRENRRLSKVLKDECGIDFKNTN